MSFVVAPDTVTVVENVSKYLSDVISKLNSSEGSQPKCLVTIALSGGSMPDLLVSAIADLKKSLSDDEFERLRFVFADERHVPLDGADSNYAASVKALSASIPGAQFVPIDPTLKLSDCAVDYKAKLMAICPIDKDTGLPIIDVVLLGMGPDGHTASLFPGHELLKSTDVVAHIDDSPKPPPSRVTLTLPVINAAKHVAFIATGASKLDVLKDHCTGSLMRPPLTASKDYRSPSKAISFDSETEF